MIHYGKTPQGDLDIIVSADNVGEVYDMLYSSGLLPRRVLELQEYIEKEFPVELAAYRRRMAAQQDFIAGSSRHRTMHRCTKQCEE